MHERSYLSNPIWCPPYCSSKEAIIVFCTGSLVIMMKNWRSVIFREQALRTEAIQKKNKCAWKPKFREELLRNVNELKILPLLFTSSIQWWFYLFFLNFVILPFGLLWLNGRKILKNKKCLEVLGIISIHPVGSQKRNATQLLWGTYGGIEVGFGEPGGSDRRCFPSSSPPSGGLRRGVACGATAAVGSHPPRLRNGRRRGGSGTTK